MTSAPGSSLPALASIHTGLYPPRHGVHDDLDALVGAAASATVAERIRASGTPTAAFVGSSALGRRSGLDHGFDHFDQPAGSVVRDAVEVAEAALEWILELDSQRFFVWLHYADARPPHVSGGRFLPLAKDDPYLAEVAHADSQINRVIERLDGHGVLDDALVIVVGSYGDARSEYGEAAWGIACSEAALRVPLVLRYPDGARAGEVSNEIVSVVDLAPTMLAVCGLEPGDGAALLDGISLYPNEVPADRGVYVESLFGHLNYGWSPVLGWIDGERRLVLDPTPRLFDVDPQAAAEDLAGVEAVEPFVERLRHVLESRPAPAGALDVAALLATEAAAVPSDVSAELAKVQAALEVARNQPPMVAAKAWGEVLAINPGNLFALVAQARELQSADRWTEAAALYEEALRRGERRAQSLVDFGLCLERAGDREAAIEQYMRATERDPYHLAALDNLARVLSLEGRLDEAERVRARRARASYPK